MAREGYGWWDCRYQRLGRAAAAVWWAAGFDHRDDDRAGGRHHRTYWREGGQKCCRVRLAQADDRGLWHAGCGYFGKFSVALDTPICAEFHGVCYVSGAGGPGDAGDAPCAAQYGGDPVALRR